MHIHINKAVIYGRFNIGICSVIREITGQESGTDNSQIYVLQS